MDKCYKCKSTEKLSAKKYQRGIVTFICNSCRNTERIKKIAVEPPRPPKTEFDIEAWEQRSQETLHRLSQRPVHI